MLVRILAIAVAALFLLPLRAHAESANLYALTSNTKITLERGMCYGSCPVYKVEIFGNGRVVFSSDERYGDWQEGAKKLFAYPDGVLLPGVHEDRISPQSVAALVRRFERAKFLDLKDEYAAQITDMSASTLTLRIGSRTKSVLDYVGLQVGMPRSVDELEDAVDELAGASRWVYGTIDLIPWLELKGFDFRSADASQLVAAAASGNGTDELVLALIHRGAPMEGAFTTTSDRMRNRSDVMKAGQGILEGAIERGNASLLKKLTAFSWFKHLDKRRAVVAFARSGAGCSPKLVDAAADAGIQIDLPVKIDDEPQNTTALAKLVTWYGCAGEEGSQDSTVERLLARGANPNFRDSNGATPLFGVHDVATLDLLLKYGADPQARDSRGLSALFKIYDDAVALRLLQLGASPAGRDAECKTFADLANERDLHETSKWLAAHPQALKHPPTENLKADEACGPP